VRYLVVSVDALKRNIRTSEHFPCIVEAPSWYSPQEIIAGVFKDGFRPRYGKQYVVAPMESAVKVTFNPREYNVTVEDF
jgi:hypothetical protein